MPGLLSYFPGHAQVQKNLYAYLSTEFVSTETVYSATRRVGTVLQVMHTIKYFYWVVNPEDRSGVMPRGLGELPPTSLTVRLSHRQHQHPLAIKLFMLSSQREYQTV